MSRAQHTSTAKLLYTDINVKLTLYDCVIRDGRMFDAWYVKNVRWVSVKQ